MIPTEDTKQQLGRPRLMDRIEPQPSRTERWGRSTRRAGRIVGLCLLALLIGVGFLLVRAFLESRWTLPETSITARIEEDLFYNVTYNESSSDIENINYGTDEIIHQGNPATGVEGVQGVVERNQTENRVNYQLKDKRDILVATSTEVQVANRPLFDKTAIVAHLEQSFLVGPADSGRQRAYTSYEVRGKRLHAQTTTTLVAEGASNRLANTLFEYSEVWGWFGDRARAGSKLVEYSRRLPEAKLARFVSEHRAWHDQQKTRLANPFRETLKALAPHERPIFTTDEGWPGPWWQLDLLPQGINLDLHADRDGKTNHRVRISWDKTGLFPWRWLNGGYIARDSVGELFRIRIRDHWLHFKNQLEYLYFLDLDGNGKIDRELELIGQVNYLPADSPLKESFKRKGDVVLTRERTEEFTRNKTYVFRVGADPERSMEDFWLCDAIEKMIPDAINKGFARDSHLAYIERARDDFILTHELTPAALHSAVNQEDALAWKAAVVKLLETTQRPYAAELADYYFGDPEFPDYREAQGATPQDPVSRDAAEPPTVQQGAVVVPDSLAPEPPAAATAQDSTGPTPDES